MKEKGGGPQLITLGGGGRQFDSSAKGKGELACLPPGSYTQIWGGGDHDFEGGFHSFITRGLTSYLYRRSRCERRGTSLLVAERHKEKGNRANLEGKSLILVLSSTKNS